MQIVDWHTVISKKLEDLQRTWKWLSNQMNEIILKTWTDPLQEDTIVKLISQK